MPLGTRRYYYLGLDGPKRVPTAAQVRGARSRGAVPVFLLDANVCFQLMRVGDGKAQLDHFPEARQLLIDAETSGIDVAPGFGLLELALDKPTHDLDVPEYTARASAVSRALNGQPSGTGEPGAESAFHTDATPDSAKVFLPIVRYYYGGLLKILELTRRGLSARVAFENLEALTSWMNDSARAISPILLQVGAAVFGGDSQVHPFLRINKKGVDPLAAAATAAWDLLYVTVMQMGTVVPIGAEHQDVIFATDDGPLFGIARHLAMRALFKGLPVGEVPLMSLSTDYPHFRQHQDRLKTLSWQMQRAQASRITSTAPPPDLTPEIERLEAALRPPVA